MCSLVRLHYKPKVEICVTNIGFYWSEAVSLPSTNKKKNNIEYIYKRSTLCSE